jgi:hypothetical protein
LRYSAPPLVACTKPPSRPAASGDSNSTGHCVVAILRASGGSARARRRSGPRPRAGQLGSRCASSCTRRRAACRRPCRRSAPPTCCGASWRSRRGNPRVGAEEMALLGRHARAFAVGDAPVGGSAAASHSSASSAASSLVIAQGWNRSRSRCSPGLRMSAGVGQAGHRVFGGEAGDVVGRLHRLLDGGAEKSDVLALPRRWPR